MIDGYTAISAAAGALSGAIGGPIGVGVGALSGAIGSLFDRLSSSCTESTVVQIAIKIFATIAAAVLLTGASFGACAIFALKTHAIMIIGTFAFVAAVQLYISTIQKPSKES